MSFPATKEEAMALGPIEAARAIIAYAARHGSDPAEIGECEDASIVEMLRDGAAHLRGDEP